MNKILVRSGLIALLAAGSLSMLTPGIAMAAPSSWSQLTSWIKAKATQPKPYWINASNTLPLAVNGQPYTHRINLVEFVRDDAAGQPKWQFTLNGKHPNWLQISSDGQYLEGNLNIVNSHPGNIQITIAVKNLTSQQAGPTQTFIISVQPGQPARPAPLPVPHPEAAVTNLEKLTNWVKEQTEISSKEVSSKEAALSELMQEIAPVQKQKPAAPTTPVEKQKPAAPTAPLEKQKPVAPATPIEKQKPAAPAVNAITPETKTPAPQKVTEPPHWNISEFPPVAINQKNYEDINLSEYVSDKIENDSFLFSLTPGKTNPRWVTLQANGLLKINSAAINPEDIETTQIIYVTATSSHTNQSTAGQFILKIIANDKLSAPQWQAHFNIPDAIAGKPYFLNLAGAINTANLLDNDQLIFQLVSSSANWLHIGDNGYSLVAKEIPTDAGGKYFEIILRVTSKMGAKSTDFNGRIYVNPTPQPLQWQTLPSATLGKNYTVDLSRYVTSNMKNDTFTFKVNIATLPSWLSVQNNQILTGIPKNAGLLSAPQSVEVTAESRLTGLSGKTTVTIPVNSDPQLAPQWTQNFLSNPIANIPYRSDDLMTVLENRYPQDQLGFEYLSGPSWMSLNSLCHCLASTGDVPASDAGKSYTIKLRVNSKASGKTVDYEQTIKVYMGEPQWTKTVLPDVNIAEGGTVTFPLTDYTQDDISGDQFDYQIDQFHSPSWISLRKNGHETQIVVNTQAISPNEVDTAQTVRLLATSQSTHKTTAQLLVINVKPNPQLPKPVWKGPTSLPIVTVGVAHASDLTSYIQSSVANDRLTVQLGANNPSWLTVKDNRLNGAPPREAVGGPYPVTLLVHSQATNTDTELHVQISVQLVLVIDDNLETHEFFTNHKSIVIRGLLKNHKYRLFEVKGSHFDYGPFYSPYAIKTEEDWNGYPFFAIGNDKTIQTGDDGIVSIVYYTDPLSPAPQFEMVILR